MPEARKVPVMLTRFALPRENEFNQNKKEYNAHVLMHGEGPDQ